jgi:hypothetical protein
LENDLKNEINALKEKKKTLHNNLPDNLEACHAISLSAPSQGYSTMEEERRADSDLRRSDY